MSGPPPPTGEVIHNPQAKVKDFWTKNARGMSCTAWAGKKTTTTGCSPPPLPIKSQLSVTLETPVPMSTQKSIMSSQEISVIWQSVTQEVGVNVLMTISVNFVGFCVCSFRLSRTHGCASFRHFSFQASKMEWVAQASQRSTAGGKLSDIVLQILQGHPLKTAVACCCALVFWDQFKTWRVTRGITGPSWSWPFLGGVQGRGAFIKLLLGWGSGPPLSIFQTCGTVGIQCLKHFCLLPSTGSSH